MSGWGFSTLTLTTAGALGYLGATAAWAGNVLVDGSLTNSAPVALVGPNYAIGANIGLLRGNNLFHSFGSFSLGAGESATFTGPSNVANVIGRVTGGQPSNINGAINSSISGANLYLINPSGIVFGAGSSVNVSGSFHASTADYIKFGDGARFYASTQNGSSVSAAAPVAFGFLGPPKAGITITNTMISGASGATVGIVGGPVTVSNSSISAPAGTIHLTSAAGAGEVPVDPRSGAITARPLGPVSVTNSILDVSDPANLGSGGSVFLNGGPLQLSNSVINADNYGTGGGGTIAISSDGQITIDTGSTVSASATSSGPGASVSVTTQSLALLDSVVSTGSAADGPAGAVTLIVNGTLSLSNGVIQVQNVGSGGAGALSITAGAIAATGASSVASVSNGPANAGNLQVSVAGSLTFDASSVDSSTAVLLGLQSVGLADGGPGSVKVTAGSINLANAKIAADTSNAAPAGTVGVISSGDITLAQGAAISANTTGAGAGGLVAVTSAGTLTMSGSSLISSRSGTNDNNPSDPLGSAGDIIVRAGTVAFSDNAGVSASTFGTGRGGNVTVDAQTLQLTTGAFIAANTRGFGNAGNITVNVAGQLTIDGSGAESDTAISSISGSNNDVGGTQLGDAGNVSVSAGSLTVRATGYIASDTYSTGRAGDVTVNVAGLLTIDGANANLATTISSDSGYSKANPTDVFGQAGAVNVSAQSIKLVNGGSISSDAYGTGRGGDVKVVSTGDLLIANESSISSDTLGRGNAGVVLVNVAGPLTIDGANASNGTFISSDSGYNGANATDVFGHAGAVNVSAQSIKLVNGGSISSDNYGTGGGGDVKVVSATDLLISGASSISSDTIGLGNAGAVNVNVGGLLTIDGSAFGSATYISSASGQNTNPGGLELGDAGTVTISAGGLTIRATGGVSSDTFSTGRAGDVTVNVSGQLTIDGANADQITYISTDSGHPGVNPTDAFGPGGRVQVVSQNLTLTGGAEISSNAYGAGSGGDVVVHVGGAISLDGAQPTQSTNVISANTYGAGNAGAVQLSAGSLSLRQNGQISSSTANSGAAGDVTVTVTGALTVDGAASSNATGIETNTIGAGNGGRVSVRAASLDIRDYGFITSSATSSGNAGAIDVVVAGAATISGNLPTYFTGLSSQSQSSSPGAAGDVSFQAQSLYLGPHGAISAASFGSGSAGSVTTTIGGSLTIDAANTGLFTGIYANAGSSATGSGGQIVVSAGPTTIRNGGFISASTSSTAPVNPAQGGSITLSTPLLTLAGASGIYARSDGSADAGSIMITSGPVALSGNSAISSTNFGSGNGGDVVLRSAGPITLDGSDTAIGAAASVGSAGSIVVTGSRLTLSNGAELLTSAGSGSGGNITVNLGGLLLVKPGSGIIASAEGGNGNGGNVSLTARNIVFQDGTLVAQAVKGHGGNIVLVTDAFIDTPNTVISANSSQGANGTVTVQGVDTVVTAGLVELSDRFLNAAQISRNACAGFVDSEDGGSSVTYRSAASVQLGVSGPQRGVYFLGKPIIPAGPRATFDRLPSDSVTSVRVACR